MREERQRRDAPRATARREARRACSTRCAPPFAERVEHRAAERDRCSVSRRRRRRRLAAPLGIDVDDAAAVAGQQPVGLGFGQRFDVAQLARDRRALAAGVVERLADLVEPFLGLARGSSPNLPNSVLTAPSTRHTSVERFSIASVRKPSCRLFSIAARFIGPASITRNSRCSASASPGRDTASAYRPSVGTNRIAKSVVCGGSTYLSRIDRACGLEERVERLAARLDRRDVGALDRLLQPLVVLERKLGVDRQPARRAVLAAPGKLDRELDALACCPAASRRSARIAPASASRRAARRAAPRPSRRGS